MIRLVEPTHPALKNITGSPLIAAQIQAQAACTGPEGALGGGVRREFWVGFDSRGEPGSWLCRSGDSLWAAAREGDLARETADFIRLLGCSLLQTDDAAALPLSQAENGERRPIMLWQGCPSPVGQPQAAVQRPGDPSGVRPVMDLHARAGEVPPGEGWDRLYGELHLRCRRGVAATAVVTAQNTPVACAALEAIGQDCAVVSHVCTLPEYRGRGYAARAVLALCGLAKELQKIPVLCCREELVPFYQGMGFAPAGEGHWVFQAGGGEAGPD